MNGVVIDFSKLPSRGRRYPQNCEIYITPLNVRQQMEMDKYGVTTAEYYNTCLQGVTLQNVSFPKDKILFADLQYIDLMRRLFTFDTQQEVKVSNLVCWGVDEGTCTEENLTYSFKVNQIEFEELPEDLFETQVVGSEETGEYEEVTGKKYTFSDGLEVVVAPLTAREFIDMSVKYVTNNKKVTQADMYIAYLSYAIKYAKGKVFKDKNDLREFLFDYIGNISNNKDMEILAKIEKETLSNIKPFKFHCPKCGKDLEVRVSPNTQFHQ